MNTKQFFSVSRLTLLALTCMLTLSFAACGGDDDNDEPSVDELLSDKTTPVTFELAHGDYYMFDYSGSQYIGSDTIHMDNSGKYETNLRQGKHHIVWISLGNDNQQQYLQWTEYVNSVGNGVVFDTSKREILYTANNQNLSYGLTDLDVSPYLLPTQKVDFEKITTCLQIEITDKIPFEPEYKGNYLFQGVTQNVGKDVFLTAYIFGIGTFSGLQPLQSISTDNGGSIVSNKTWDIAIGTGALTINNTDVVFDYLPEVYSPKVVMLCPQEGLNDIQLKAAVSDYNGQAIQTTALPIFSLRQGYTTTLRGPLFSGSTTDWVVAVEPYDN